MRVIIKVSEMQDYFVYSENFAVYVFFFIISLRCSHVIVDILCGFSISSEGRFFKVSKGSMYF